jgi:hypothetical protein
MHAWESLMPLPWRGRFFIRLRAIGKQHGELIYYRSKSLFSSAVPLLFRATAPLRDVRRRRATSGVPELFCIRMRKESV